MPISKLTDEQINDINNLKAICDSHYNTSEPCFAENDANAFEDIPCFYLKYNLSKLVFFMSVFYLSSLSCEIYSLTDPEFPDELYFKACMNEIIETASKLGINEISFVNNHSDTYNADIIKMHYSTLAESSLLMELSSSVYGNYKDNNYYFDLDVEPSEYDSSKSMCFLLKKRKYGYATLEIYTSSIFIHHVEIARLYRGKGYSNYLLDDLFRYVSNNHPDCNRLVLNVDSYNAPALALYKKHGFTCVEQLDYYALDKKHIE